MNATTTNHTPRWLGGLVICAAAALSATATASPIVIDFSEDDSGRVLTNGQAINGRLDADDPVKEFGALVNIGYRDLHGSADHVGPVIFDSTPGGPNGGNDPDLQVGLGNILMLQDNLPWSSTTIDPVHGLLFDVPNDEEYDGDAGAIVFDFLSPVELVSITVIDVDDRAGITLTLTDSSGDQRVFDVPADFTYDITDEPGGKGWEKVAFDELGPQVGEGGASVTVTQNDAGFDLADVLQLDVAFTGEKPSAAIDNVAFIPEPSAAALAMLAALALIPGLRRR